MEDSEILELYWSRDEQAIAETRASYGVPLLALANRILSSREDSEETVSDTFLRAWQTIPPERPKNFLAFLRRICRNLAFDRLDWNRAAKRNPELIALTTELEQCIPDLRQGEIPDRLSLKATLEAFLRQLPKESRGIFLRRYLYGDSVGEIAQRYAVSESKVKMQLHRTREKLRRFLEQEGIAL